MTSPLTDEQLKDMLAACEGELLPCPFCSGAMLHYHKEGEETWWEHPVWDTISIGQQAIYCPVYGWRAWDRDVKKIALWNRPGQTVSSLITELLELRAERGKE